MANVPRVKYFTEERKALINPDNLKKYQKYLQSSIIKNKDVKDTTYKIYDNFFVQFLVYIAENWDNIDIYSEDFMDNAVDIMEGFIMFCQETLLNHKKVINTKLSAVSSFYIWSMKRGYIKYHPFDGKLDRMKKANEEKVINSYFLTEDQVQTIRRELSENDKFTIQDQILFEVSFDSANRIGALEQLALSKLDIENNMFVGVREKEGYITEVVFGEVAESLDDDANTFKPYELAVDVAYSRMLSETFSAGVALRFIYSDLAYKGEGSDALKPASAFAADIAFYHNGYLNLGGHESQLGWGLNISNVGSKLYIKYSLRYGDNNNCGHHRHNDGENCGSDDS